MLATDSLQDWVTAFMQYLFPSSGLVGLVESTKDSEAAYKLWHDKAAIGRVLAMLKNEDVNQDEMLLAGAIMAALNSQKFAQKFNQIEKQQNSGKFKGQDPNRLTYQLLGTEALKALTDGNPDHIATLAALTAKAFLNSKDYPPQIVEQAFWALAWKTSSTAAEIEQVYTGMSANELQLSQPYHKEQDYDSWKNAKADKENAETLLGDPFLATYIGAGYNVYDAPLPPNITYGESFYLKTKFPACGEDSLWNLFNIFLWDNKTKQFDVSRLEKIKASEKLIAFYQKFPKPINSQAARNAWAEVVSGIQGVVYQNATKLSNGQNVCNIPGARGIDNMQAVLKHLLHLNGATKEEIFTELCDLFSANDNKWQWRTSAGKDKIESNTDITIDFYHSGQKMFDWQFLSRHFVVHTLVTDTLRWQNRFGEELLELSHEKVFPEINFYVDERLVQEWLKPGPLFWTLAYGNLYSEAGKEAVITALLKHHERAQYPFVEKLMKQMPTTDQRIQKFIVDCLLFDGEYIENSNHQWMKEELKKWRNKASDTNIADIMKNEFSNLVMFLAANGANVNEKDDNGKTAHKSTRNQGFKSYLANIMQVMHYPSNRQEFKTPYAYFTWAEESLKNPPEHLPVQAVDIGMLEVLMGKYFGINENQIAKGQTALDIAKAIATVAKNTGNNALTDQVWLSLDDRDTASPKIKKHHMAVYILESYARNHDANITRQEILTTTSPIFKDIPMETRSQYVTAAIHNYGKDIDMAVGG